MTDEKTTNELLRDSKSLLVRTALRLAEVEKERDALMVATGEDGPKITRTILEAQAKKLARLEAAESTAVAALAEMREAAWQAAHSSALYVCRAERRCPDEATAAADPNRPLYRCSLCVLRTVLVSAPADLLDLATARDRRVRADAIMWAADRYDLPAGNGGGSWAAVRARFRALSEEVRRG